MRRRETTLPFKVTKSSPNKKQRKLNFSALTENNTQLTNEIKQEKEGSSINRAPNDTEGMSCEEKLREFDLNSMFNSIVGKYGPCVG